MLHGPHLRTAAIVCHDSFDVIAIKGISPSGSTIAIKKGLPKVLVISAFIELNHACIGCPAGRGCHGMLHTVRVYGIGFPIHLIADVLIGVITSASHYRIERVQGSIGIIIVAACFHVGVVIPVITGCCRHQHTAHGCVL